MTDGSTLVDLDAPTPAASREGRFLPWLWIAVGALLIAGVVSAFVVDGEPEPGERLAAAAAIAEESGTFGYSLLLETSGPFTSTVTIEGAVDARSGRSRSTIDSGDTAIETISDGDVLYVKVPEGAREAFGGKPWAQLGVAALSASFGGASPTSSPLETFEQLREAGKVEKLGREEVRGVSTTRFRTVIDMSGSVPESGPAEVRNALKDVEVEVWLDDDDRIRRHRSTLDLATVAGNDSIGLVTTIETFDFGKTLDIEVPPADQVADAGAGDFGSLFAPRPPVAESSTD